MPRQLLQQMVLWQKAAGLAQQVARQMAVLPPAELGYLSILVALVVPPEPVNAVAEVVGLLVTLVVMVLPVLHLATPPVLAVVAVVVLVAPVRLQQEAALVLAAMVATQ